MLSTLLATKLHRPRPTLNLLARPRLTQGLDGGLRDDLCLMLVVAPAGYGKTTLNLPSDKMHRPLETLMPITDQLAVL
ncbi:MAG: hypothetical protein JSW37_14300 [Anaerolineales bacterium]|nr:MAG: hypothetical protein JSW37_14300 [Anaerolineales bacterium]